jgi:hypothetical protein
MKQLPDSKLFPHLNVYLADTAEEVVAKLQGMHSHYQKYVELIKMSMWEHCDERRKRDYLIVEHKVPSTGVMASPTLTVIPFNKAMAWAATAVFSCDRQPDTHEVAQLRRMCQEYSFNFDYTPGTWF